MNYRIMTENDLKYVVEKIMNTTTTSKAAVGPTKKHIKEFIRYSQWKIRCAWFKWILLTR